MSWRHGGRVYSTQWAEVTAPESCELPGPASIAAIGRSYFRFVASRPPGMITAEFLATGGTRYWGRLLPVPLLEFGPPRLGINAHQRWATFPILGGFAAQPVISVGSAGELLSIHDDPLGRAGSLRFTARRRADALWIGIELEAFLPRFPPDSPVYRLVQLPVHELLGQWFLRWWRRHLVEFAEHTGST